MRKNNSKIEYGKEAPQCRTVFYKEDTHQYFVNGKLVPSVTQLVSELFPNKYYNVPTDILERKAEYGTQIHLMIQIIEERKPKNPITYLKRYFGMDYIQEESIKQYLDLKKKYQIEVIECEKIVAYKDYYAGRLDIIAMVKGYKTLIDIKTTAELDKVALAWQCSLYEKALGERLRLKCLWLPKKKLGKLEEVERIDDKMLSSLIGEVKL